MIPQELIDRLKKCCKWLGKNMPEKYNSINALLIFKFKGSEFRLIDFFQENPIRPDPLCEYPNALHRIVKEACNEELHRRLKRLPYAQKLDQDFVPIRWFYKLNLIKYDKPLHAEIEATCIAIEGLMK